MGAFMTRHKNRDFESCAFRLAGGAIVGLSAVLCLVPLILIVSASLTDERTLITQGIKFWPENFSLDAYRAILDRPKRVIDAYWTSIRVTFVGTALSLAVTSLAAYALSRKDLKQRNRVAFFVYFTSVFSGGLIPVYMLVSQYLQLKNTLWALILPPLTNAWFTLLLRNFMAGIPDSIRESAKIDGAGEFLIYRKLYLPLSQSGLVMVGLFVSHQYWNDWFQAMLYIDTQALQPLQYFLYSMLSSIEFAKAAAEGAIGASVSLPTESIKMAMAVIATAPILLMYPFVQGYFVRGLSIGAVKG
jgi:putative aldouronate transport system permease protein